MSVHALLPPALARSFAVHEEADPVAAWVVVTVLVLGTAVTAGLRVIAADERLVIRRRGRATRVRGPGPTFVVPGLERGVRVSLRPRRLGPVWVTARTADAVTAHAAVSARMQVVEPARVMAGDVACRAATALEQSVSAELARVGVAALAHGREALEQAVTRRCEPAAARFGARLVCVEIVDIKLDLDAHLVEWADCRTGARGAR